MHKTVLLNEAIDGLNLKEDSVVVDATFGGGGHSAEILKKYPKVKLIALDQDAGVWKSQPGISFHNENFRNLDKVMDKEGIGEVDGIIFDLGLSSDQLENSGRGFSFMKDEPLIMTMKDQKDSLPLPEDLTAQDVVNTWSEESLEKIIGGYGEERFARLIAHRIVEARKENPIRTTLDFVKVIGGKRGRVHPATKTFQAIRIAVNDELGALSEGLEKGFNLLKAEGRMSVISFHSLEDRVVKRFFKDKEKEREAVLVNKKVILASKEEVKNNPRARSAKLRILEKI